MAFYLYQVRENGLIGVINCAGRKLNKAEKNYTVTEKEMLAAVTGIKKYRSYLLGREFNVATDHKTLIFLNQCRLNSGRLMR